MATAAAPGHAARFPRGWLRRPRWVLRWPFLATALLLTVTALFLRLHLPAARPLHNDEAVQAAKLGDLLEGRGYRYDPADHHGPTLYFVTALVARALGRHAFADLDEALIRSVPALFGAASVLLALAAHRWIGDTAAIAAAAFGAVSPLGVYFSRYFIQEPLLVAGTALLFAAAWTWIRRGSWTWAIVAGAAAGGMLATKGTAPLAFGSIAVAILVVERPWRIGARRWRRRCLQAVCALLVTFLVAATWFTQGFTDGAGLIAAAETFGPAARRAGGGGHSAPWWGHLALFTGGRFGPWWWSEAALLALAATGAIAAVCDHAWGGHGRRLLQAAAIATGLLLFAYSVIPYKTPWLALNCVPGLALLAGAGAAFLLRAARERAGLLVATAVALGISLLAVWHGIQSARAAWVRPADTRNPYAYVQAVPDVVRLGDFASRLAAVHPDGTAMPILVRTRETWPLPWYLRHLSAVSYTAAPPPPAPPPAETGLIIVSAEDARAWEITLGPTWIPSIHGLRPGHTLVAFTPESLLSSLP